jgi:hypothetical protein
MNIARNHIHPALAPSMGETQGRAGDEYADLPLASDLRHIDWQTLRARVFASRDTMAVPGADHAASRLHLRGSFAGGTASKLTVYQSSLNPINLDGSSNRKPADGNTGASADADADGERG